MRLLLLQTLIVSTVVLVGANSTRAGLLVEAVVVDPRLAATGALATDGSSLFTVSPVTTAPFVRVFSVPVGGGALTQLYSYNGQAIPNFVAPSGIAVLGEDLYWIDAQSGSITDTQILSAPKDGSGSVTAIYNGRTVGEPIVDGASLATDGSKLYTADRVQGRIHSLNPDGSGITQLASRYGGFFDRAHGSAIAVLDGTVWIADSGLAGFGDTPPRVQSVSISGGAVSTLFLGALADFRPNGIAVGADLIYLSNGNQILQMPRAGGTPSLFLTDPSFGSLGSLVLHGDTLYAMDAGATTIWRISPTAVPEPSSVALLGMGALGLVGVAWRRRSAARGWKNPESNSARESCGAKDAETNAP